MVILLWGNFIKKTTIQAFKEMIQTRGIHNALEISNGEVEEVRKKINNHALSNPLKWGLSKDLMDGWLRKVGYIKITETLWESEKFDVKNEYYRNR